MRTLWSELPRPRTEEIAADASTAAWLAIWLILGYRLYSRLAGLATGIGQVRAGGTAFEAAGAQVGEVLARIPVVGEPAGDVIRLAFSAAAAPFIIAGTSLEGFVLFVAALLTFLVVAVPVGLWMNHYLPWRVRRFSSLRAARLVIRAPGLPAAEVQRLLASRALHRLSYGELRGFTPDPFGDWVSGRYDRLARAELAAVGLKPT